GSVHLLEQVARLALLMALQVHPGQCQERYRVGVLALRPLPAICASRRRLAGQLGGPSQAATHGLHQREMAEAVDAFGLISRRSRSGRPCMEDTGRLVETA